MGSICSLALPNMLQGLPVIHQGRPLHAWSKGVIRTMKLSENTLQIDYRLGTGEEKNEDLQDCQRREQRSAMKMRSQEQRR